MKKGYILIGIAVIVLCTAGILMINKPSYAQPINQCLSKIKLFAGDNAEIYVKNNNNKIDLPYGRFYMENSTPPANPRDYRFFYGDNYIFEKEIISEDGSNHIRYNINGRSIKRSDTNSILMNYLINETYFSDDKDEDDYYKQLLLLWAMDRLAGYDDNKNYVRSDDYENIVETEKDTKYEDKYEIDTNTIYPSMHWKYINNLSAGDKELLKDSAMGSKMIKYLSDWENYINWYLNDNQEVQIDPIDQETITYHVTNEYIETNLITPKSTGKIYSDKFESYEVKVSAPMIVIDQNGQEKTTFKAGESFRVRMPITEIKDKTLTYTIDIEGKFNFNSLGLYETPPPRRYDPPMNERQQLYKDLSSSYVHRNCAFTEILNANLSLSITQQVGNLNIKVIDASTGNNLSKAEIIVYDNQNNIVYQYETTEKEFNIVLPVGDYTIKQIVTPPNYEATTIQMRVSVTENNTSEAVLENVPLISVPDTNKTSKIAMTIGFVILITGILILGVILKIKNKN